MCVLKQVSKPSQEAKINNSMLLKTHLFKTRCISDDALMQKKNDMH